MKKFFVFIVMIILGMGAAMAQPGGGGQRMSPEERLKRDVDQLKEALSLSADQVAKITPVLKEANEKQSEAFRKMRESGGQPDFAKMQEQRAKMQAETDTKINALITKEQQAKLKAYREQQKKEREERMRNRQ